MTETRGRHLRLVGYALLFGVIGAMFGFCMADRGVRWFPTMVDTLLLMLEAGLLLIMGSRILEGSAVKQTAQTHGRRLFRLIYASKMELPTGVKTRPDSLFLETNT